MVAVGRFAGRVIRNEDDKEEISRKCSRSAVLGQ